MASLDQKNGVFVIRFRYGGKQFKKSLRTRDETDADGALHLVQHTIYRLTTGQLEIPPGVDPGDFIVSGGKMTAPPPAADPPTAPSLSLAALIEKYLAAQFTKARSSMSTERTHLTNLKRVLGSVSDGPCDEINRAHLTSFLQQRREQRAADTAKKERMTIQHLFAWACARDPHAKSRSRAAQNQRGRRSERQVSDDHRN